MGNWRLVAGT
ncbi:UNVERIFIED_CONTAM: hypothetical protein GTU68_059670 [Idotea baltica]|nr:hypothetical protein [Idotea baltica]